MAERRDLGRWTDRIGMRVAALPALLAFIVVVVAWFVAEDQNRRAFEERLRAEVSGEVSLLRARLEGNLQSNLQLVQGLVVVLSREPGMDQQRFGELAEGIIRQGTQLRHLAAAPDLVVTMVHPLRGNERAIGLDYRNSQTQRDAAMRARNTGAAVLAGPVELIQGGQGLIGRFPVFVPGEDGQQRFWGIVSAVIDIEQLFRDSGLYDAAATRNLVLIGRDGLSTDGDSIFGSVSVLDEDPVTARVNLLSGSWLIAAVPHSGWNATPDNAWLLRLLMLAAGALVMVPSVLTSRLLAQRYHHIQEMKSREAELDRLSRRFRIALETSRLGVWEMSVNTGELLWDDRMNQLYGSPPDGGPRDYHSWACRLHPDDKQRAEREFQQAIASRDRYVSDYRLQMEDGEIRHIRAIGSVFQDAGAPERIVGVNWDVTADVKLNEDLKKVSEITEARNAELEAAKASIEFNALHDSLTGLANRRYLDEVLTEHAIRFGRSEETAGLLHIDLDRFKQINDTLGHAAGDAMLVHAATVLRETVCANDFVARVGGDEFVVLVREHAGAPDGGVRRLARLAERIIHALQRPVMHQGHECRVGASIGIATDLDQTADPLRLLVNADIALYRAKARGRNRYQFFNEALQAEISHTKRIADDILSGIEQQQFIAHYQPQFDADTLEIIGVEALARWKHPTEGLLSPAAFMKIAEELNVVATIDRMILEQAICDFDVWRAAGIAIPKVSVNVSARRLTDEELIRSLRDMKIEPGTVSFELVESIFLDEDDEITSWNVDRIKELGIDIEIDDFGTGYASIVSLMKLNPQRLKIDRQFIAPVTHSQQQRQLVRSIIEIGRSLGIEVLAEGVETMEHAQILRMLGCRGLQGYAFARPMSADALADFTRERRWRVAS